MMLRDELRRRLLEGRGIYVKEELADAENGLAAIPHSRTYLPRIATVVCQGLPSESVMVSCPTCRSLYP